MCSSKSKLQGGGNVVSDDMVSGTTISDINGRPVLQPATSNRVQNVPLLERRNSLKKTTITSAKSSSNIHPSPLLQTNLSSSQNTTTNNAKPNNYRHNSSVLTTPPISPKIKSPRQPAMKRGGTDPNSWLTSSVEKVILTPRCTTKPVTPVKKSKKCISTTSGGGGKCDDSTPPSVVGLDCSTYSIVLKNSAYSRSSCVVEAPGSIAAARREQVAVMQVQRKLRIAHYGRSKSAKYTYEANLTAAAAIDSSSLTTTTTTNVSREEKRCSFITPNSDPIYVAYHDEEWGVPTHDDKLLFELLVLTGAQVGSDWTSVLKKRQQFRDAFSGFDAEFVSKFSEKKITSISGDYGIEVSHVRGVVDNSNRILEIKKTFGSFDKYLWGFVNHKPIATQYKSSHKMPVKTSKSEAISKDMVRRGFRLVGPTVIHSFMQAAGLTNDHLTTCPRHLKCVALSSQLPTVAPAL